jgi:hypothetical protein
MFKAQEDFQTPSAGCSTLIVPRSATRLGVPYDNHGDTPMRCLPHVTPGPHAKSFVEVGILRPSLVLSTLIRPCR